ncbi:hypothetical protein [Methylocella silvestris]|uniref:Uncharacterized protein n=1 Tax=Methylocella silvestris TaxID=199596 RepID=A0A2J7TLJ2_METSI|nr:hypothetical protein [Methylocella silvestris]PNG27642.1 hypothetical protein CR492_01640 [Methylocella silvestris]
MTPENSDIFIVLPPGNGLRNSQSVGGVVFSCQPGSTLTVPRSVAQALSAAGWLIGAQVVTSATRPARQAAQPNGAPRPEEFGESVFDQTIGKLIIWDGWTWRDLTGAAV